MHEDDIDWGLHHGIVAVSEWDLIKITARRQLPREVADRYINQYVGKEYLMWPSSAIMELTAAQVRLYEKTPTLWANRYSNEDENK